MSAPDRDLELEVARLFSQEAHYLDRKQWPAWLALYCEDAEYWAPAWASEEEITTDPANELSLIYLRGRGGLQDRVYRIEARDSLATVPLDRTAHVVGSVLVQSAGAHGEIEASCSWITHVYSVRGAATLGGYSDYTLRREAGALRIAKKRVVLIDDRLEIPVDVYHL
jgi:3-phenylpropionate/cinnamic acid dioxygenase small subunit